MKIRNGFVSNSSSSSYLLGFKKKPQSAQELQKLLFGKLAFITPDWSNGSISARSVSQRLFQDIQNQSPATIREIAEEVRNSVNIPWPKNSSDKAYYTHRLAELHESTCIAERLIKTNFKDLEVYCVNYSDNNGSELEAYLESEEPYEAISHYRISHH